MKRQHIIIIVVVLLVLLSLISAFSGVFSSGETSKEEEEEKEEEKVEQANPEKECTTRSILEQSGSLGFCESPDDIIPTSVTFTGQYFSPKSPIRGTEWIHELSSSDNKKEYVASHQSADNYCKMVRFEITKDDKEDKCEYKVLDAGYATSPSDKSSCKSTGRVVEKWTSKNNQKLVTDNRGKGYGIKQMKYTKFC
jgi:hypothetical protein